MQELHVDEAEGFISDKEIIKKKRCKWIVAVSCLIVALVAIICGILHVLGDSKTSKVTINWASVAIDDTVSHYYIGIKKEGSSDLYAFNDVVVAPQNEFTSPNLTIGQRYKFAVKVSNTTKDLLLETDWITAKENVDLTVEDTDGDRFILKFSLPNPFMTVELKKEKDDWSKRKSIFIGNYSEFELPILDYNARYSVRAGIPEGKDALFFSDEIKFHTPLIPMPQNLKVTQVTGFNATISWESPIEVEHLVKEYHVAYREYCSFCEYTDKLYPVGKVNASMRSAFVDALYSGTKFQFAVAAYNGKGFSHVAITPYQSTLPYPLFITFERITDNSYNLTWSSKFTDYVLQYKKSHKDWTEATSLNLTFEKDTKPYLNIRSYILSPLELNNNYTIRMAPRVDTVNLTFPREIALSVVKVPVPRNLKASIGPSHVNLAWDAPVDGIDSVDGYEVGKLTKFFRSSFRYLVKVNSSLLEAKILIISNKHYQFAVRAFKGQSKSVSIKSQWLLTYLDPPELRWRRLSAISFVVWKFYTRTKYVVQVKEAQQAWIEAQEIHNENETSITIGDLKQDTTYVLRAMFLGQENNSTFSKEVIFATYYVPRPKFIRVTNIENRNISLEWEMPEEEIPEGTMLYIGYSRVSSLDAQVISYKYKEFDVSSTSTTIDDLYPNTEYIFSIMAKNGNSSSYPLVTTNYTYTRPYSIFTPRYDRLGTTYFRFKISAFTNVKHAIQYKELDEGWESAKGRKVSKGAKYVELRSLRKNMTYSVRIYSIGDSGLMSDISAEANFSTFEVPTPRNIKVSDISTDSVKVSWTRPENGHELVKYYEVKQMPSCSSCNSHFFMYPKKVKSNKLETKISMSKMYLKNKAAVRAVMENDASPLIQSKWFYLKDENKAPNFPQV